MLNKKILFVLIVTFFEISIAQYAPNSPLINNPQQQQNLGINNIRPGHIQQPQQQQQPTSVYGSGRAPYIGGNMADGNVKQYAYGQFQPLAQSQQVQPNLPGNTYNSNTVSSNTASNSLTSKLEQQLRPLQQQHQQQSLQQQKQQQQKYNPHNNRYESESGGSYGTSTNVYGGASGYSGGGVNLQIQLKAYANPERQLAFGKLCSCPAGNQDCINKSPSRTGYSCLFAFTVIITSKDSVIHKSSTPYLLLNANGQITQEDLPNFQRTMEFQLDSEPTAINVFVQNLGPVFDAGGNIIAINTVSDVDTFVKQLNENNGVYSENNENYGAQQPQQINLVGIQLGTQLSLTYTISCRGQLIGPGCDLACNHSTVISSNAVCVNTKTGFFSLCRWTTSNNQVSQCKNCPWGIKENAYCRDENGGILEANHAGVVSEGYQTATVILAIICGFLAFCLIVTCVYNCTRISRKQRTTSRTPPTYTAATAGNPSSTTTYVTHTGAADVNAPLNGAPNGSTPPPRYLPPLMNGKAKASLRSPMIFALPPATAASLNDTLNSSFTGSQAPNPPPSVSADV